MTITISKAVEYIVQEVLDYGVSDLNSKEIQARIKELFIQIRSEPDLFLKEQKLDEIINRVKEVLIYFSSCNACSIWTAKFTNDYNAHHISSEPKSYNGCRRMCNFRMTWFNQNESYAKPKPELTIDEKLDFLLQLLRIEFNI